MHIAIIGNGISGVTAARFIRKLSDHKITLISAESKHFFSRTALMYVYMGHMQWKDIEPYEDWFWEKNRIDLIQDRVEAVDATANTLRMQSGKDIQYDKLIIASGSTPNKFGWPGQDLDGVGQLYSKQDLEYMEQYTDGLKRAVIVGGGLIGIEMAEMFLSRKIPVTFLVREKSYWNGVLPDEESAMINRHIKEHHVDLRLATELKEILPDEHGKVRAVITNTGEEISCEFVGLTAGVRPNIQFLNGSGIETQRGIMVNDYLQTNIENIYAIGDCAQMKTPEAGRRPIEAIWYTGKMMGETLAYTICKAPIKYSPRLWFNSAKFFDIEYQVYGDVRANVPEHHASIYWEHQEGRKSIRLVYDKAEKTILGFNLMGIRYRHEVCEKWLKQKTSIEEVLQHLGLANFDPEFFDEYEAELVKLYNRQTGENLTLKQSRSAKAIPKFLPVRKERTDAVQEEGVKGFFEQKSNLQLGGMILLIFAILVMAYNAFKFWGVLYVLPVVIVIGYFLRKRLSKSVKLSNQ